MRRNGAKEGFTLIEMMVTVAILGLGLTIVSIKIDTFLPKTRIQAACRKLVSDMDDLRLAAVMIYKQPVYLEYDLTNHGYRAYLPVEYDEDMNVIGPGVTELMSFKDFPENIIFTDVRLGGKVDAFEDASVVTVLINPDGSVTGHIVHVQDELYGKEYSMRVASLTGFAEVFDYRVEYEEVDESAF
jgi:prepilin-type N-terminal cleavage/methylation domain-containing protein